ncbi:hypothetical protein [Corallococcus sp. M7]
MKRLELIRDPAKQFPQIDNPLAYNEAKIWHCKFRSLEPLAAFANLETLIIATYPGPDLSPLSALVKLRRLRILHFPKVTNLAPLGALKRLEALSLETTPGWDASGKKLHMESLAPLAKLTQLKHLCLMRVVGDLTPLKQLKGLETACLSGFPKQEVAAYFEATGIREENGPQIE